MKIFSVKKVVATCVENSKSAGNKVACGIELVLYDRISRLKTFDFGMSAGLCLFLGFSNFSFRDISRALAQTLKKSWMSVDFDNRIKFTLSRNGSAFPLYNLKANPYGLYTYSL